MIKIAIAFALVYLLLSLYLYINQRQFIYFPSQIFMTPEEAGLHDMRVIHLKTEDGLELRAWWRPPLKPELPTLVHLHGNAGNIGHRAVLLPPFLEEGYGVLLLTYRGYSGNPGEPSEAGFYRDARAVMAFLDQNGIETQSVVLYGHSMGAAVALKMATEYSIKALILQSPFTSLKELGQHHYPIFPVKWLITDVFDSLKIAKDVRSPSLVLYGEDDDIVPSTFTLKLYGALPEPKQLVGIPLSGHNDLFVPETMIRFINRN